MAADPTKLCYFSLPGEVRNKIMNYVLVPGDIYPRSPVSETPTRNPDAPFKAGSRPGVQLIATCKQAYHEGHSLLYSLNTFHLPPTTTFLWADRLQAKHKALVKRISITLGLNESTPAMLNQIESSMSKRVRQKHGILWAEEISDALVELWKSKLGYIAAWTSLEEIELCSFGRTCILQHHDIVAHLGQLDVGYLGGFNYQNPYWRDVLWASRKYLINNIAAKVDRVGWRKTKEWLVVRKPDGIAKGVVYWPRIFDTNEDHGGIVKVTWRQKQ